MKKSNDYLALAFNEASEAKKTNKETIDAVLGALKDEEGKLWVFDIVNKINKELFDSEIYQYNSAIQSETFISHMKHWVFGKVLPKYEKKFSMSVAITPGTSTALFISLSMNNKIPVLNSDLTWPMYEKAAQVVGQKYFSYSFLSNKYTFNDVSFKRTINKIFEKYGAINIIFNDPCHNPTGYTMDKNDWKKIVEILNGFVNKKINLILDTAYIEFSWTSEIFFKQILNFNKNINIFLSYSCSKTFSIYGLRLGVLFILTKKSISNDKKISTELLKYTRAIYSNPPTLPISIINKIFSNELYFNTYINELKIHKDTLNERAKIFLNEAKENKLVHCKYLGGFFIFIPCKNSFKIYQKLKKEAVYIAPIDGGIRISLGYLNKNEVKGLAEKIKKAL